MKKVLYVDDSEDMLEIIQVVLENSGYQIITASNGHDALDICTNEQPDLILMDLKMPELDGFTVTEKLRESGYTKPIIVLSASESQEDKDRARAVGCTDYILKTLDMGNVESIIDSYIAEAGVED